MPPNVLQINLKVSSLEALQAESGVHHGPLDEFANAFQDGRFDRAWASEERRKIRSLFLQVVGEDGNGNDFANIGPDGLHKCKLLLMAIMLEFRQQLDQEFSDGKTLILDPFIRGITLEQATWRFDQFGLPTSWIIVETFDKLCGTNKDLEFSIASQIADLGWMSNAYGYNILNRCYSGAFPDHVAATVLARWGWPTQQKHVDAVLDFLANAKHVPEKLDAIDTLVLLGKIDEVDADNKAIWLKTGIAKRNNPVRRLRYLMGSRSGRSQLMDWYQNTELSPELKRHMRNVYNR